MDHGMVWGVKDSLVAYIEGLEDGVVELVAPAERLADGFGFPLDEGGAVTAGPGTASGPAHGATPVAETGELVEGITAQRKPDTFDVKY